MRTIEAIERDLYWQRHVRDNAKNAAQRERAMRAITRLEIELREALRRSSRLA